LLGQLEEYISKGFALRNLVLLFAVFTQPYCMVEENEGAIAFFHRLLLNNEKEKEKMTVSSPFFISSPF